MKNSATASRNDFIRPVFRGAWAAMVAGLIASILPGVMARAQPDDEGAEVLTRGPVHEAFAGVVSYNPEPGVVVRKAPPELIEEIPPEEKPEGDDVAWIPGYWAWDDERNDFLWISGTWRSLPPGREWMAGYWRETDGGYQWISGYWADAEVRETTYLPPPPTTLEVGPNVDPPSLDYGWTPGCWEWRQSRYVWRAGYWSPGRADWVWVPSYYVWTPRGFIFVPGYWDYVVERRGLLFAPVYYRSHVHLRRGYHYAPRIVISLSIFDDCLFLRPTYHHYYFGDYYDSRYDRSGFYVSFSFQSSRRGYDPFYSHRRWEHRGDRDWEHRYQATYRNRRDNEAARPPRTWSAQVTTTTTTTTRTVLAEPIEQLTRRKDNPVRFQRVAEGERQRFSQRGREVQKSRDDRRTVEAKAAVTAARAGETVEPSKEAVPRSPIVGKPSGQRGRNQVPPDKPQAPRVGPVDSQPGPATPGRQPNTDARDDERGNRRPAPEKREQTEKREQPERRADTTRETNVAPAPEARSGDGATATREEPRRKTPESDARDREADEKSRGAAREKQPADERANAGAVRAQEEAQRKEQQAREKASQARSNQEAEAAARAQRQAEERANAAAERTQDEARRAQQARDKTPADDSRRSEEAEAGARAQRQAEERANAARAQEETRRVQPASDKGRQDTERRPKEAEKARAKTKGEGEEEEKKEKSR